MIHYTYENVKELGLMADWIKQVSDLQKERGIPANVDFGIDNNQEYLIYGVDWGKENPFGDAEELFEAGWRLVSTEAEKIPDFWGTGYVLKLVA